MNHLWISHLSLQLWKISKFQRVYTIRLDRHCAAAAKGLQEAENNDNFAELSEAFYLAEKKTTESVAMRLKVQKELLMKEKERMDQQLRCLGLKARSAGATGAARQDDVM